MLKFGGYSTQFRVDHIHIDKSTYSVANNGKLMLLGGPLNGVIDHNLLSFGTNMGWIHFVNGAGTGDAAWAAATGFGGSNFIFAEDNTTEARPDPYFSPPAYTATMSDCHTGGRFVLRYNHLSNSGLGQTHPTGHAGHDRGCRAHEIYGNVVETTYNRYTEQPSFAFEYNNSGPALVWGNSLGGMFKNILYFNVIRANSGTYNQAATPNGWGYCGTEFNGIGSNWDGNTNSTSGYPCLDQPGRGQGNLLSGNFPNQINTTTGQISWPNQALEPVYEWLTTGDIVTGWGGSWLSNQTETRIVANQDYYLHHNNSGCNQNAATCATGVGSGTLAQRPANCTTGTAWWATDQGGNWNTTNGSANDGALYRCIAANTWSLYYTPYTYPHPLTLADSAQPPPRAPTGVIIR
jgi:hypothetical protein